MPPKSSTMIGLAIGAAVLLGSVIMGKYGRTARMKKQIEELVIASKHITTEHDAALLSMKMQALNLQLLADIREDMREANDREAVMSKACERSIEQTAKDNAEIASLLRQLVNHLAPSADADTEVDRQEQLNTWAKPTNPWEAGLRSRYSPAALDEVYSQCCMIAMSSTTVKVDPYPAMGRLLLSDDYVDEDREHVKKWFVRQQLVRGDVKPEE